MFFFRGRNSQEEEPLQIISTPFISATVPPLFVGVDTLSRYWRGFSLESVLGRFSVDFGRF